MKKTYLLGGFLLLFVFNFSSSSAQSWKWAKQSSGGNGTVADGTDVDMYKSGIYFTGYFQNALTVGSVKLKAGNSSFTSFLVKYNTTGKLLWAKQSRGTLSALSEQFSNSVVTDKLGNVYITGGYIDSAYFGTFKLTGATNAKQQVFLVKYDSMGNVLWARQSTNIGAGDAQALSLSTDAKNNIYITGKFDENILFGRIKLSGPGFFIAKYDQNGNVLWAVAPPNDYNSSGYAIAANDAGDCYITGTFSGTLKLGRSTLTNDGGDAYFVAKYNPRGHPVWAQQCKNTPDSKGNAITLDAAGNIYTTGNYEGKALFGGTKPLPYYVDHNLFLAKYDSSGKFRWVTSPTKLNKAEWEGYALTSDKNCNIYLLGGSNSNVPDVQFGSKLLSLNYGSAPLAIVKYDSAGKAQCASVIGDGGEDPSGLVSDHAGSFVYVGGDIADTATLGPDKIGPLKNTGEWIFLTKWEACNNAAADNRTKK